MLPAILEAIVPVVVTLIQSIFAKTGQPLSDSDKRDWVLGFLKEVEKAVDPYIPSWVKPEESVLEALLVDAIDRAIDKVEGK